MAQPVVVWVSPRLMRRLATSLTPTQANTAQIVDYYRQLQAAETRFRVVGDFLRLRPVRHWTEQRVRGHVAVCVYAALIETLINHALAAADVRDPDLGDQHLTATRALRDLNRVRRHQLTANGYRIHLTTRRSPLQTRYGSKHPPNSGLTSRMCQVVVGVSLLALAALRL